jgi:hypothetical protein
MPLPANPALRARLAQSWNPTRSQPGSGPENPPLIKDHQVNRTKPRVEKALVTSGAWWLPDGCRSISTARTTAPWQPAGR